MSTPEQRELITAKYLCPGGTNKYNPGPTEYEHYLLEKYLSFLSIPKYGVCTIHQRRTTLVSTTSATKPNE